MLITPNGNGLIGANVTSQYEQTIKRDIESDIPQEFVKGVSQQKAFIDFVNGYRLMFRPFDDPDKLRSYNIDFFLILEGSECKFEALTQLKARLRNTAATSLPFQKDWRRGIIESNPDSGWIRSEVLYKSSLIYKHGNILDKYNQQASELDPATSSHVASSDVNTFLPPTFIQDLARGKPDWWVRRMIHSSFLYAEGLVYPSATSHIVPTFTIPKHWKRIVAFDYGLSDDAVFLFGAVDERHNLLFIYKEVRTSNRSVEQLAALYHEASVDIPTGGLICPPIIDPKSGPKRDYDKKTLSDHFLDYGIAFISGQVSVDARIFRLNTYMELGYIKICDCCVDVIKELREYKFAPKSLDKHTSLQDKPVDKNNHGINAMEWITMELPADPKNLLRGVYGREGRLDGPKKDEEKFAIHALDSYNSYDDYNSIGGPYDLKTW